MSKIHPSQKASSFTESVIREQTRMALQHGAINLSQGYPDFAAPMELKEAARQAIADDINQYPLTWGTEAFREAIAANYRDRHGMSWVDPQSHVTVTCGSTEAMIASMLGVLDPGDEVEIFEPFYDRKGAGEVRVIIAKQYRADLRPRCAPVTIRVCIGDRLDDETVTSNSQRFVFTVPHAARKWETSRRTDPGSVRPAANRPG